MSDNYLEAVFNSVQKQYFTKKHKKVDVQYQQFRSLKHTIEWNPWKIKIKVNQHFSNAPDKILKYLAIILLAKVYRIKVSKEIRQTYNDYIEELKDLLPARKYNRLDAYSPQGNVYNLTDIFNHLNSAYFSNRLAVPVLGWSINKSYRRLGFFDKERNLLVISRIFDRIDIPEKIVCYLVYHEMLHILFPSERRNGRRIIHSTKFREIERQFPEYEEIQNWLNKNVRKL